MKLNLGCGRKQFHKEGWVNVDANLACEPDVFLNVAEIDIVWPWKDNSVTQAIADNLIEHFGWGPHGEDLLMWFMNEAHRVIKPTGTLWIRVPDFERWPWGAIRDPTHRRYFVGGSFDYWDGGHQTWKNYGQFYGYKPWEMLAKVEAFAPHGHAFLDVTQRPIK